MALERDPSTTKNAFLLLKGAGRGVISEHGAQMAIELLENNGFQIWEIKPDPPVEPTPAPPPIPRFGSYESILLHEQDFRNKLRDLEDSGCVAVCALTVLGHKPPQLHAVYVRHLPLLDGDIRRTVVFVVLEFAEFVSDLPNVIFGDLDGLHDKGLADKVLVFDCHF